MSPNEAFEWLLSHKNCDVVVIQRPEREELRGAPILPEIDRRIGDGEHPSSKPVPIAEKTASRDAQGSTRPVFLEDSGEVRGDSGRFSNWALAGGIGVAALATLAVVNGWTPQQKGAAAAPEEDASRVEVQAADHEEKQPGKEEHATPQPEASPSKDESPPAPVEEEQLPDDGIDRSFFIAADTRLTPCADQLDDFQPMPGQPLASARVYFRQAQKSLIDGEKERAHRQLCESASLDSTGPGAQELARFLLAERSYEQARNTLQPLLAQPKVSREVKLLEGDLLSLEGRPEEALRSWLAAISLKPEETKKRRIVSKKYVTDAALASRHAGYALAERYLRRAVTFDPENLAAMEALSVVLLKQELKEAAQIWQAKADQLRSGESSGR